MKKKVLSYVLVFVMVSCLLSLRLTASSLSGNNLWLVTMLGELEQNGDVLCVEFSVTNLTGEASGVTLILASYNEIGQLLGSSTSVASIADGSAEVLSSNLVILSSAVTAKAFLFDQNFVPIYDAVVRGVNLPSTGLGVMLNVSNSCSADGDNLGLIQVDSVYAVVTLNKQAIITHCTLDSAQTKINFNSEGQITSNRMDEVQTNYEKGTNNEWNELATAFSEWAVGKTAEEVEELAPDIPWANTSGTVDVDEFTEAIVKAAANAREGIAGSGGYKTGLGTQLYIERSADAANNLDGKGHVDSYIVAVTVDSEGTVVACTIDGTVTILNINENGEITSDLSDIYKTKLELGAAYGMAHVSTIHAEWYEQANAFAEWVIGKTLDEVKNMKLKVDESGALPDEPELAASVTLHVDGFIIALEKAINSAK